MNIEWMPSDEIEGAEFALCAVNSYHPIYRKNGEYTIYQWSIPNVGTEKVAGPFSTFEAARAAWELISEGGTK